MTGAHLRLRPPVRRRIALFAETFAKSAIGAIAPAYLRPVGCSTTPCSGSRPSRRSSTFFPDIHTS